MRLVCARSHPWERPNTDRVFDTEAAWLEHLLIEHGPRRLVEWLVDVGFLDAPAEYFELSWRWDFWNAKLAAKYREDEQRRWEAKAAAARARWGEGASPKRGADPIAVCARCGRPARNLLGHFDCGWPRASS